MISGDSTASHIGSAKNIEKARERRTFEVMPGSAATGIPEELQEHSQTIHPRMGYDMSDSLFMQQQEAAAMSKESKRALEERTALEAFRAAALQKPFDPAAAAGSSRAAGDAGAAGGSGGSGSRGAGGDSKRKQPPAPLAGIKLRKKASRSGVASSSSVASRGATTDETGASGQAGDGETSAAVGASGAGEKRSAEAAGGEEGEGGGGSGKKEGGSGSGGGSGSKKSKKKKGSKKSRGGRHGKDAREGGGDVEAPAAGLGLGLVAYSSGEDEEA